MKNKLKVIQLIDSLNAGGAEMMAVNIANALAEKDIESHLCATRLEGEIKTKLLPLVSYIFLNKKRTLDFRAIKKLNTYINTHQITTIHAHSSSYFIGCLIKLWNPKIILIWHNHYGNSKKLSYQKKLPLIVLSKFFNAVISVNKSLNKWSLNYLNVRRGYYVPNFASFNKNVNNKTFLKGTNNKRIVCLANLRPEKDHINLLKAFQIVHKKQLEWTLHLVGINFQDTYANKIKAYITLNKLSNHVFLYGSCNDIQYILEQASIGVLSSKFEGLPVALLEYGLAKLPVVVTEVGECAKVITHKKSGLVVAPNNKNELAKALETLVLNKDLCTLLGTELFKTVETNYSKSNFIKTLISIYTID